MGMLRQYFQVTTLLLLLVAGRGAFALNGDGPVEYVDITPGKDATEIRVRFVRPVFYVYHTPQTEGNSVLIGVQDSGIYLDRNASRQLRQIITFDRKLAPFIDGMEYIRENGFPPYIMVDFDSKYRYQITNARDMRTLVVTVFTKKDKQDKAKP